MSAITGSASSQIDQDCVSGCKTVTDAVKFFVTSFFVTDLFPHSSGAYWQLKRMDVPRSSLIFISGRWESAQQSYRYKSCHCRFLDFQPRHLCWSGCSDEDLSRIDGLWFQDIVERVFHAQTAQRCSSPSSGLLRISLNFCAENVSPNVSIMSGISWLVFFMVTLLLPLQ